MYRYRCIRPGKKPAGCHLLLSSRPTWWMELPTCHCAGPTTCAVRSPHPQPDVLLAGRAAGQLRALCTLCMRASCWLWRPRGPHALTPAPSLGYLPPRQRGARSVPLQAGLGCRRAGRLRDFGRPRPRAAAATAANDTVAGVRRRRRARAGAAALQVCQVAPGEELCGRQRGGRAGGLGCFGKLDTSGGPGRQHTTTRRKRTHSAQAGGMRIEHHTIPAVPHQSSSSRRAIRTSGRSRQSAACGP